MTMSVVKNDSNSYYEDGIPINIRHGGGGGGIGCLKGHRQYAILFVPLM